MSIVPKFVSKRASKEFHRGYSPEFMLKAACAFTLAGSIAAAGDVKRGTTDWLGEAGGHIANGVELVGGAAVTAFDILWEGGGSAVDNFDKEFDGEAPALPVLDVSLSDSSPQQVTSESGYIIQPDDSYFRILGNLGMSPELIAECDARVSLSNQPVLLAGQPFSNPC